MRAKRTLGVRRLACALECASLLAPLLLLLPLAVAAQTPCPPAARVEAVRLVKKAADASGAGRHDDALRDYKSAYTVCPEPEVRRLVGEELLVLDRLEEAAASFASCFDEAREETLRDRCHKRKLELADRLSRGTLAVSCGPVACVVHLDGSSAGQPSSPPISLPVGRHEVEVRAEGRIPWQTSVDVPGGRETRLSARLDPVPPPPAAVVELPKPGPKPVARSAAWNWVGLGAVTALVGGGAAALGQYLKDRSDRTPGQSLGQNNLIAGCVLVPAGVAAIVTSAVLWPDSGPAATWVPGPGGGSLAVTVGW